MCGELAGELIGVKACVLVGGELVEGNERVVGLAHAVKGVPEPNHRANDAKHDEHDVKITLTTRQPPVEWGYGVVSGEGGEGQVL